jgi:peptidoglycan hydrolase-like protein with peptidoglycan-binding domain
MTRRPVDTFALFGAAAATLVIIVNAVFLQSGAHPAPFVASSTPQAAPADTSPKPVMQGTLKPADMTPAHTAPAPQQAAAVPLPVSAPARRNDPIADLIGSSQRILAVQRVLSQYGYGQIKLSGTLDDATSQAIEKFEREHKLPVSGRVSDRLVSELNAMAGSAHPIE